MANEMFIEVPWLFQIKRQIFWAASPYSSPSPTPPCLELSYECRGSAAIFQSWGNQPNDHKGRTMGWQDRECWVRNDIELLFQSMATCPEMCCWDKYLLPGYFPVFVGFLLCEANTINNNSCRHHHHHHHHHICSPASAKPPGHSLGFII